MITTKSVFGLVIDPQQQPMQPATDKSHQPTLADVLTIEPSLSIFYAYARELDLSRLLTEEKSRLTLFAPVNKAVMAMHRKP